MCIKVCETCPWLIKNHGKPHPHHWYAKWNIRRLWNGIRNGKAAGVTCHASDPKAPAYGGHNIRASSQPHPCAGAILYLSKHVDAMNDAPSYDAYRNLFDLPVSKKVFLKLLERQLFSGKAMPDVEDRRDEIGVPWEERTVQK